MSFAREKFRWTGICDMLIGKREVGNFKTAGPQVDFQHEV